MIKAATISLGLTLLFVTAPLAFSQTGQEAAVNEAVYRQANRITLRQKLVAAQSALERRDYPAAAKLYDDAWELILKIGAGVDEEVRQTKAGLAAAARHGNSAAGSMAAPLPAVHIQLANA